MNTEVTKRQKVDNNLIDLRVLFLKLKSLWYVCVIGVLVGSLAGVFYYSVLSTPTYESTAMVYLRSSSKKISLESLQLNTSLTQDYQVIFTSRPNIEAVIKDLHLKYTVDQLKDMITISNPEETRILQVTVISTNAKEAKNIANDLVEQGMDDIREIDSQEPFVVEKAITNNKRVGLGLAKTTLKFGLIGFLVCAVFIIGKYIVTDVFTSTEEVEKTLGLPVLAVIAEEKTLSYAKLTTKKGKRHHGHKEAQES